MCQKYLGSANFILLESRFIGLYQSHLADGRRSLLLVQTDGQHAPPQPRPALRNSAG